MRPTTQRREITVKPDCRSDRRTISMTKSRNAALPSKPSAIVIAVGEQVLQPRLSLVDAAEDQLGPTLSDTSAVVRLTISSRPSIPTATWRLHPTIFLLPS